MKPNHPLVVIGAGPAGLTAAYELARRGFPVVVYEKDEAVGGLARTVEYKGFRFDIGGHRFFTKVPIVQELWRTMLGAEFMRRPRLSRIYYRGRFFHYPLKPADALLNLGIGTSIMVLFSYLRVTMFPIRPETSFADWVSNRFGRHLYGIFFKSYTEKVWGIPAHAIGARWAAQRIKGLSLRTALLQAITGRRHGATKSSITSLISDFEYPRLGPGMMWEAFRARIEAAGGRVELGCRVVDVLHEGPRATAVRVERRGLSFVQPVAHVISTSPLRHLIRALRPEPPPAVMLAVDQLQHRAFLTVALIVGKSDVFPDNWIYVHDESVKVGRIQNYKNWSADMVPVPGYTCLGLEYFCREGDSLWSMTDSDLIDLAKSELAAIGLAAADDVVDGTVVRMPDAYPVYDDGFEERVELAKEYLSRFENVQTVGRNGTHQYNNQDHSMLTAILAVRNVLEEEHDVWTVNTDDSYHEELVLERSSR